MNFAKFVMEAKPEHNGHKQLIVNHMTVKQGKKLCKALENYTDGENLFAMELYCDGSFSIVQKDFWKEDEHPLGHIDRLILSVENQ